MRASLPYTDECLIRSVVDAGHCVALLMRKLYNTARKTRPMALVGQGENWTRVGSTHVLRGYRLDPSPTLVNN